MQDAASRDKLDGLLRRLPLLVTQLALTPRIASSVADLRSFFDRFLVSDDIPALFHFLQKMT